MSIQYTAPGFKPMGKLIVAKGFKKLPKVQKIAKSGHTATTEHRSGKYLSF